MARVKSIAARRHRKLRKLTKGYSNARRRRVKSSIEAVLHAGQYAFAGRRLRKRDMRALWITRLGAAVREEGINYNMFISGLKKANITLDRKMLSEIAISDPQTFKAIVAKVK
jgi:large subunit ribosomal protein L20